MELLYAAAKRVNEHLDSIGISAIGDRIEEYLNDKFASQKGKKHKPICDWNRYIYDIKIRAEKSIQAGKIRSNTRIYKLDIIAAAIDYESYHDFLKKNNRTENGPIAMYCANWWSVVRANKGSFLFKAPINLSQHPDGRFVLRMKGEHSMYEGSVQLADGVLYCHLHDAQNKHIYMVMKVGKSTSPSLLQGVFSTISNAGDPICGREVWQKEEAMNFDDMHWQKIHLNANEAEPILVEYFANEKDNCIKINGVSSFTISDLHSN